MFFMHQLNFKKHQKSINFIYTFFNAKTSLVFLSITFHTTPYAPLPNFY